MLCRPNDDLRWRLVNDGSGMESDQSSSQRQSSMQTAQMVHQQVHLLVNFTKKFFRSFSIWNSFIFGNKNLIKLQNMLWKLNLNFRIEVFDIKLKWFKSVWRQSESNSTNAQHYWAMSCFSSLGHLQIGILIHNSEMLIFKWEPHKLCEDCDRHAPLPENDKRSVS